jgi:hypothetical protein
VDDTDPGWQAREWLMLCSRRRGRGPADEADDISSQIRELIRIGVDPQALLAEIKNPARNRAEYFWQFKNRFLDRDGQVKETEQQESDRKAREEAEREKIIQAARAAEKQAADELAAKQKAKYDESVRKHLIWLAGKPERDRERDRKWAAEQALKNQGA